MNKINRNLSIQKCFVFSALLASLFNSLNLSLFKIPINPFLYLAFFLGIVLAIKNFNDISRNRKDYNILFLFFIILLISVIFSKFEYNQENIILIIINFLLIVCIYIFNNELEYDYVYNTIIIFSTLVSLLSLVLGLINYDGTFIGNKLAGLYSNPNQGGPIVLFSLILLIYKLKKEKERKIIKIILICIQLIFLYFNKTRSVYFAVILLSIIYIITKCKKNTIITLICISFLSIPVIYIQKNQLFSDSIDINQYTKCEIALNNLSTERYAIWKESLILITLNNYIGYGNGNLNIAASTLLGNNSRIRVRNITATHNIFLQILIDGGIIALLIFFLFLFILLKEVFKILRNNNLFSDEGLPSTLALTALLLTQLDVGIINYLIITSFIFWSQSKLILNSKKNIKNQGGIL